MPKLPALTSKKVVSVLKKSGFTLDHTTGSHYIFLNPTNRRRVSVPFHRKDLPKGTLLAIIKSAGLSKADFLK